MTARSASPPPEQPPSGNKPQEAHQQSQEVQLLEEPSTTTTTTSASSSASASSHELKTANHVYLLDPEHSWIPAQVISKKKEEAELSIPQYINQQAIVCDGGRTARRLTKQTVDLTNYANHALPLQNVDGEGRLAVVDDMVDLPFLHEVSTSY
jgi:hypothetical protein